MSCSVTRVWVFVAYLLDDKIIDYFYARIFVNFKKFFIHNTNVNMKFISRILIQKLINFALVQAYLKMLSRKTDLVSYISMQETGRM